MSVVYKIIGAVIAVPLYFLVLKMFHLIMPQETWFATHLVKFFIPALALFLLSFVLLKSVHYRAYNRYAGHTLIGLAAFGALSEIRRLLPYKSESISWLKLFVNFDKMTFMGMLVALMVAGVMYHHAKKGSTKTRLGANKSKRSEETLHGDARFMGMKELGKLFPAGEGICLGERYRPDEDEKAGTYFRPDDKSTWGKGGTQPLLCYNGDFGSTHGMVFAGSGSFKTTGLVIPTALTWSSSMVVLDPSREIAPMVKTHRAAAFGKDALFLDPSLEHVGFNVLDWIDRAEFKEQAISETANWLSAEKPPGQGGNSEFFSTSATQLICGVLAHIILDKSVPKKNKTLRYLRTIIASPEPKLKEKLELIHESSDSPFVRETVGPFIKLAEQTFSGVYATASKDTNWLSFENFGRMVSEPHTDISEIRNGKLDVYINIALKDIRNHPGFARVVVGSLLNEIIEADGQVADRTLFMLDEAVSIGKMKAIEVARDQGRKYGITLMMVYQAVGQLKDTWGHNALSSWSESCTYRIYAGLNDQATAAEVAKAIGSYTVDQRSQNTSKSSSYKMLGSHSVSSSKNERQQHQKRDLIMAHEILSDMRLDEQIIFVTGRPPIRCGRAIYFRRPEMVEMVEESRFKV